MLKRAEPSESNATSNSLEALRPQYLRPLIQVGGFVRKELADIIRQPRLVLVLVAGPFLILMLFAAGYDQNSVRLRTIFVGPEGSIYETSLDSYDDEMGRYVETLGFTDDAVAAEQSLKDGDADLVVIFPPDPAETVLGGEQASIVMLHNKLDPLQQTAVEVSAQVAVQELNATVLEQLVGEAQAALQPFGESLDTTTRLVEEIRVAADAGNDEQVDVTSQDLRLTLQSLQTAGKVSNGVVTNLRGSADPDQQERLGEMNQTIGEMNTALATLETASTDAETQAAARQLSELSERLGPQANELLTLDPRVATRPFVADTESLLRVSTRESDFFAPSAVSLLLQHLVITFAALALVRDEALGLFETYRVGPVSSHHVLAGKYVAYVTIGAVVGALLVASMVFGLDVPMRGSLLWVAVTIAALLLASIGLGLVMSSLARSDSQAVQYAMLILLASMFFGGFFLSLDAFRYPIRLLSWALPVTYAIRSLQATMLRGVDPAFIDIASLIVLSVVYGALAWFFLRRRLAVR